MYWKCYIAVCRINYNNFFGQPLKKGILFEYPLKCNLSPLLTLFSNEAQHEELYRSNNSWYDPSKISCKRRRKNKIYELLSLSRIRCHRIGSIRAYEYLGNRNETMHLNRGLNLDLSMLTYRAKQKQCLWSREYPSRHTNREYFSEETNSGAGGLALPNFRVLFC